MAIGQVELPPEDYDDGRLGPWRPKYDLHMDIRRLKGVDIVSAWQEADLSDQSLEYVFSSQTFEHLSRNDQKEALRRTYNWLIPNGILEIWTPDFRRQVEMVMEGSITWDWLQTVTYGEQDYEANFHKWCHTAQSLHKVVIEAGFEVIHLSEQQGSLKLLAKRPE